MISDVRQIYDKPMEARGYHRPSRRSSGVELYAVHVRNSQPLLKHTFLHFVSRRGVFGGFEGILKEPSYVPVRGGGLLHYYFLIRPK